MNTRVSDESGQPVVYLKAAEILFLEEPATVLTVLGSCLSVTMLHRQSGLGAVCHGLLPENRGCTGCGGVCSDEARYVACSIKKMVTYFTQKGVRPEEIEVKVFGGADMFGASWNGRGRVSVGRMNIDSAQRAIDEAGLSVTSRDVGGTEGRKLYFDARTGDVLLKRIQPSSVQVGRNGNTE